jgi:hypothetical protein
MEQVALALSVPIELVALAPLVPIEFLALAPSCQRAGYHRRPVPIELPLSPPVPVSTTVAAPVNQSV